ncbi:MAG: glycerophosphodiester phosphodiesterase [Oculatellaceae cyanobacterium Prado106]|jgi:glycerophosphoryl diester phosphodiesterase|nr:glycerophosphodiester phosphodiesterase [Oculatellaceae cyanobacterium Prado106]
MDKKRIVAHRGFGARENTLAAFEGAIAIQADCIELDVRCSQDQVLIVHHDPVIGGQAIEALTWADIQRLDPEVPTLEAAIACCQGRIQLDVEIKEPGYETAVVQLLQRHLPLTDFVITSFYLAVIRAVKQSCADITVGFLIAQETIDDLGDEPFLGKYLQAMGVNFVAPHWQVLSSPFLTERIPEHLPFWVWTVNDEDLMTHLMTDAVRGDRIAALITDRADVGVEVRDRQIS